MSRNPDDEFWTPTAEDLAFAQEFHRQSVERYYAARYIEVEFVCAEPPDAFLDALHAAGWADVRWTPATSCSVVPDAGDAGLVKMVGTHGMHDGLHLLIKECAEKTGADADWATYYSGVAGPEGHA